MNAEMVTRIIQEIIAPVVMVTSCSILLGGLLSHYAAINDRLRAIARERFELLRAAPSPLDPLTGERLGEFKVQVPDLLHRHRLMEDAVLAVFTAIGVFVLDMFVIAVFAVAPVDWIGTGVLAVFLIGTAILLFGVAITAFEIRLSHRAVRFEAERGLELQVEFNTDAGRDRSRVADMAKGGLRE